MKAISFEWDGPYLKSFKYEKLNDTQIAEIKREFESIKRQRYNKLKKQITQEFNLESDYKMELGSMMRQAQEERKMRELMEKCTFGEKDEKGCLDAQEVTSKIRRQIERQAAGFRIKAKMNGYEVD